MAMTSKQRMITALERGIPDRLPVTTHHLMQYYLDKYEGGISAQDFFDRYHLDPITWQVLHKPIPGSGDYPDPLQGEVGFLEARRITRIGLQIWRKRIGERRRRRLRHRVRAPQRHAGGHEQACAARRDRN